MTNFPLSGLRVINFGWVWAAPILGHTLADLGAEVIKVESNKRPDLVRCIPPYVADKLNESMYGHNTIRNHLSISLDMAFPEGRQIAVDLVRTADVVVENFSPRVMQKFGLDYRSLRKVRPDVIMVSMSAAGQVGPMAQMTTYGSVISCLAGLDGLQGHQDERALPFGTSIADPINGMLGAFAVMACLRHRSRTGKGQHIDLSQWEATATTTGGPFMDYLLNGRLQAPIGNYDESMAPHGVYRCKGEDLWVTIAVKTDEEWRRLCEAIGRHDLATSEKYGDLYGRLLHHDEIDAVLANWAAQRDNYEITALLQKQGIAAFPAMSSKQLFTDPHFWERGDWVEVNHPYGKEIIYGMPWKLSRTPGGVRRPCPILGQDNSYIYAEVLGIPKGELKDLEATKVLN